MSARRNDSLPVVDHTVDRSYHSHDRDRATIDDRPEKPLRVQIISHLTGSTVDRDVVNVPDVDVVVAAGDLADSAIDAGCRLRTTFPAPVPIVMVLGDRDLAGADRATSFDQARVAAGQYGVTLLENGSAIVSGVRFVGASLWSNFRLSGHDVPSIEAALEAAEVRFRALYIGQGSPRALLSVRLHVGQHLEPHLPRSDPHDAVAGSDCSRHASRPQRALPHTLGHA